MGKLAFPVLAYIYESCIKHLDNTWFCRILENGAICDIFPAGVFDPIHKFTVDFPFAGDYNNRLCPSAACRAPSESSETLVWPSIITDSFHRGHPSPPTATHMWWICIHSSRLNTVDHASHSLDLVVWWPLFGQLALPSLFIWYWETCSSKAKRTDGCIAQRE